MTKIHKGGGVYKMVATIGKKGETEKKGHHNRGGTKRTTPRPVCNFLKSATISES